MDPRTVRLEPSTRPGAGLRPPGLRVVIGEREALAREGLVMLLSRAGFRVVAAESDVGRLVEAAVTHRPDLVITDIVMSPGAGQDGLRAALTIRDQLPGTSVVVLSAHLSRSCAADLFAAGRTGVGYLLKQRVADSRRFAADLALVASGGVVVDQEVARATVAREGREDHRLSLLTRRQRHVLSLMAQGMSNAAIAQTLVITEKSVGEHASNIYTTLDLAPSSQEHRRVLAVLSYLSAQRTTELTSMSA